MGKRKSPNHPLVATAHRLRQVRQACNAFLGRGLADMLSNTDAVDRIADDLNEREQANLADPQNHDWSLLYRGSVLDD
jgi:hypothetical protein